MQIQLPIVKIEHVFHPLITNTDKILTFLQLILRNHTINYGLADILVHELGFEIGVAYRF